MRFKIVYALVLIFGILAPTISSAQRLSGPTSNPSGSRGGILDFSYSYEEAIMGCIAHVDTGGEDECSCSASGPGIDCSCNEDSSVCTCCIDDDCVECALGAFGSTCGCYQVFLP